MKTSIKKCITVLVSFLVTVQVFQGCDYLDIVPDDKPSFSDAFKNEQTAFFTAGFSLPTAASITPSVFQMEQLHSMISPISLIVLCKIWLDNNPFTSPFFSIYDKWENCEIPPSSSDNTI